MTANDHNKEWYLEKIHALFTEEEIKDIVSQIDEIAQSDFRTWAIFHRAGLV